MSLFPVGSVLIVPGEPEIGHQHPVLEDRRSPDGLQSAEACFSEKYSNRRWGSAFLPFCVTPSFSPFFTALSRLRRRLHVGVLSLQTRDVQQRPRLVRVRSLPSRHLLWSRRQLLHPLRHRHSVCG